MHNATVFRLQDGNGNVGTGIDETHDPAILLASACSLALGTRVGNTQSSSEGQIGTVGTGLIPTLDGGSDRVHNDSKVQNAGLPETMGTLLAQGHTFGLIQLLELLEQQWRLGDEGSLAEKRSLRLEAILFGEGIDIEEKLLLGDVNERVADSAGVSKGRRGR